MLKLIKSIYGIIQAEHWWFKEYINIMTLKGVFKQCKTYPCLLYGVDELRNVIVTIYIYEMMAVGNKSELNNTIECINKQYVTKSMGELEDFVGCTIKRDLTNITLNISQLHLITNMTQKINKDVKSLMTFNTTATLNKSILWNKEIDTQKHTI